ncbi:MAG: single-stranded DNA-binding protein [Corynebacterium sp.]|uniref:single-stranded DNA-binding protein n=1 Tax=Corynebacterium sp. TaxID=1720 RepID=UPI0026DBB0CE|nr:single-stranded DNA-binding protein [Corynebacterium sp.]MDO5030709.1 single-stranded DNA-binding protein [Corynebacterium sp.]
MSEAVITVVGNVVHHVENRNTHSGAKVCKFSVASSRSWKGDNGWEQSETSYFDVECWGKLAENVNNTLWKGQAVIVHGHIRTDRWEGDDGTKHQRQKIIAKAVGPNLRRHLATVKTMTEKPHDAPNGVNQNGGREVAGETVKVIRGDGEVTTLDAGRVMGQAATETSFSDAPERTAAAASNAPGGSQSDADSTAAGTEELAGAGASAPF